MIVRLLFDKGVIVHPEALVQAIRGGFRYNMIACYNYTALDQAEIECIV
jgi:hypothetical protein